MMEVSDPDRRGVLSALFPRERVLTRPTERIAYASDASFYRLVPRAVVRPVSLEEIVALFGFSQAHSIPLTFRAAGTSLLGQAVTDGVLVDVSKHWGKVQVEGDGERIRLQQRVNNSERSYKSRGQRECPLPDP